MNEKIKNMLEFMVHDNVDEFKDHFDIALKEKASSHIQNISKNVSRDLFKDVQTNEDYGRSGINTGVYKFEDENEATKFFESAINAGISKKDLNVAGSEVHVGDISDSDMEETLYELAKQMNASFTEENNSFASIINVVITENNDMFVYTHNDDKIKLTPYIVENIITLHDGLNLENQKILRNSIFEDRNSFDRIVNFAKQYSSKGTVS